MIKYFCDNARHLVCQPYSIANLHKMAEDLGIKRCWFHKNHYDIPKKRIAEITQKCELVSSRRIVEIIKMETVKLRLVITKNPVHAKNQPAFFPIPVEEAIGKFPSEIIPNYVPADGGWSYCEGFGKTKVCCPHQGIPPEIAEQLINLYDLASSGDKRSKQALHDLDCDIGLALWDWHTKEV